MTVANAQRLRPGDPVRVPGVGPGRVNYIRLNTDAAGVVTSVAVSVILAKYERFANYCGTLYNAARVEPSLLRGRPLTKQDK
jgi:hypothetical protein